MARIVMEHAKDVDQYSRQYPISEEKIPDDGKQSSDIIHTSGFAPA